MAQYSIEEIKELGRFMVEVGISTLELPGLKLGRHPQESYYTALGKQAKSLVDAGAKPSEVAAAQGALGDTGKPVAAADPEGVTDEQILFDPLAGLGGKLNV